RVEPAAGQGWFRPCLVRSSEQMVEADFDPAGDPCNFRRVEVALAGVDDVAQRLQALAEKPRRLAVPVGVVAAARTMVVAQWNVNAERAARSRQSDVEQPPLF